MPGPAGRERSVGATTAGQQLGGGRASQLSSWVCMPSPRSQSLVGMPWRNYVGARVELLLQYAGACAVYGEGPMRECYDVEKLRRGTASAETCPSSECDRRSEARARQAGSGRPTDVTGWQPCNLQEKTFCKYLDVHLPRRPALSRRGIPLQAECIQPQPVS
jgi:hypothetical protein